jgi:hypothetical protein
MDYHIDLQMQRYEKYPTWQNKTATFCKKKRVPQNLWDTLFFCFPPWAPSSYTLLHKDHRFSFSLVPLEPCWNA